MRAAAPGAPADTTWSSSPRSSPRAIRDAAVARPGAINTATASARAVTDAETRRSKETERMRTTDPCPETPHTGKVRRVETFDARPQRAFPPPETRDTFPAVLTPTALQRLCRARDLLRETPDRP